MEAIARLLEEYAEQFGEVSFYNDYSGRGMYGRKCVGLSGSLRDCMQVIAEVIKDAHLCEQLNFNDVVDTLLDAQQDSMGRGVILYWPEITALEEPQEGHDGQPDEAQEWESFDPDC